MVPLKEKETGMISSKGCLFAAVTAVVSMSAVAFAGEQQEARIQALEAKITSLEAKQASNTKEVAATIDSVLRDAERRSQLLATMGDASAGYDNGFFIRAGEGWSLRPGAVFQFRNVTDYREGTSGEKSDEIENGFEVRRMQLILDGTAFSKDIEYHIQWNTDKDGGSMFLEDAWVKWMFADDWGTRLGQMKDPVTHEKLMSDSRLLAVDRSLQDATLGGGYFDRVQGATLIYGGYNKNNPLNVEIGLTDGANSKNSDFVGHYPDDPGTLNQFGAASNHQFDFGVAGRIEYKVMGDWRSYRDFTAKDNKEDLLVVGGGFDWSQGGDGDVITAAVDAQYENAGGLSLYGSILYRHADQEILAIDDSSEDWSLLLQASYLVAPQWEIFGRYAVVLFDNDVVGTDEDTFHELTAGFSYYLGQNGSALHRAKFTVDLNYLPSGSPGTIKSLGYLGDNGGDDEWVLRGQFQLAI